MIWYKISVQDDLFGDFESKERYEEVQNYVLEDLENLDDWEKEELKNLNTGLYLAMTIFIGYDEERFDEDYEKFNKVLNYGFVDSSFPRRFEYEKIKDENLLEILNSDFVDKYYSLVRGTSTNVNRPKEYIDSNGFIRDTHAKKCFIITEYLDFIKYDLEEEIEFAKKM